MYMDDGYSSSELGEMHGFFKKIGRALKKVAAPVAGLAVGVATGNPAAGISIGRGISRLTKGKSSGGGSPPAPSQAVQTGAPMPTASPQQSGGSDFFDKLLAFKMLESTTRQPQSPAPAPVMQPSPQFIPQSSAPVVVSSPAPAPMAPQASAMPPWLIPAAIGGLGLVLLMDRRKK